LTIVVSVDLPGVAPVPSIRFGLCCQFLEPPIRFRTAQATALARLPRPQQLQRLATICHENAQALLQALQYCAASGIGAFRINSQILPLKTHPQVGYALSELPQDSAIIAAFHACGDFAAAHDLRLSLHPDQFVVLNSPRREVVQNSIAELIYQAEFAEIVNADVINIHGGGGYGDKPGALQRLTAVIATLPQAVRQRLSLENDDRTYTPRDLLPICRQLRLGFVYDVHHHRCLADGMSIAAASEAAIATWTREPMFHLSSPRDGWQAKTPQSHADYIDPADIPPAWRQLPTNFTIEVEAKAKEKAVLRLRRDFAADG